MPAAVAEYYSSVHSLHARAGEIEALAELLAERVGDFDLEYDKVARTVRVIAAPDGDGAASLGDLAAGVVARLADVRGRLARTLAATATADASPAKGA